MTGKLGIGIVAYGMTVRAHCYGYRLASLLLPFSCDRLKELWYGNRAAVQAVCEALEISADQDRWVPVSEVTACS